MQKNRFPSLSARVKTSLTTLTSRHVFLVSKPWIKRAVKCHIWGLTFPNNLQFEWLLSFRLSFYCKYVGYFVPLWRKVSYYYGKCRYLLLNPNYSFDKKFRFYSRSHFGFRFWFSAIIRARIPHFSFKSFLRK